MRNTDHGFARRDDWNALKSDFDRLFLQVKQGEHGRDRVQYFRAVTYKEVGLRSPNVSFLHDAANQFVALAREIRPSQFGEESLYQAYLLYSDKLSLAKEADVVVQELKRRYPKSRYLYVLESKRQITPPRILRAQFAENASQKAARKLPVVVLDPGHGGEDDGAVGIGGLKEKNLTLSIAHETEKVLQGLGCAQVHLTRSFDTFLPLFERSEKANALHADLFVSIHLNADDHFPLKSQGMEIYTVSREASPEALGIVSRENASIDDLGGGLQSFLAELYQRGASAVSEPAARKLYNNMRSLFLSKWGGLRGRGVKQGPFYVLMGLEMPAVLLEVLFVTHPEDAMKLSNPQFRSDVATALAESICEYFEQ
ncbi:MAG: N-acetylmuramoyl-L-alanine amidase [Bdellovibrionales bacterium]|nr:N-acetylmuramoyl-L-alanine amidase [Bdellovibrionales bacterium]